MTQYMYSKPHFITGRVDRTDFHNDFYLDVFTADKTVETLSSIKADKNKIMSKLLLIQAITY